MPPFKVGDRMVNTEPGANCWKRGTVVAITKRKYHTGYDVKVVYDDGCIGSDEWPSGIGERFGYAKLTPSAVISIPLDLETYQVTTNAMDSTQIPLTERIIRREVPEPEKTLMEYGVLAKDGRLTSEGKEAFLRWLLSEYGEKFAKAVRDITKG